MQYKKGILDKLYLGFFVLKLNTPLSGFVGLFLVFGLGFLLGFFLHGNEGHVP